MYTPDAIIIGGGLCGVLIAHLLEKEGVHSQILEARNRLGGRIHTLREEGEPTIEMGATWLGKKHHHLVDLLGELGIDKYEQYMGSKGYYEPMSVSNPQLVELPPNEEPSYRIEGGTDTLTQTLAEDLEKCSVHLNHVVKRITKTGNGLKIQTEEDHFEAGIAVSTLPPKLLADNVQFSPSLPGQLIDIASQTHTWMAESIKVAVTFEKPFWRKPGSSGTIFSNVGPVSEMYDHSDEKNYALKGFMNDAYHTVTREQREQLVIDQLRRFYGEKADKYRSYRELVWHNEPFSYNDYEQPVIPHQYNGHEIFRNTFLDNRLLIAGSETATEFPGYMDGAVESARRAVRQLKEFFG